MRVSRIIPLILNNREFGHPNRLRLGEEWNKQLVNFQVRDRYVPEYQPILSGEGTGKPLAKLDGSFAAMRCKGSDIAAIIDKRCEGEVQAVIRYELGNEISYRSSLCDGG